MTDSVHNLGDLKWPPEAQDPAFEVNVEPWSYYCNERSQPLNWGLGYPSNLTIIKMLKILLIE